MSDSTYQPDASLAEERGPAARAARVVAWLISGTLAVAAGLVASGVLLLPPDPVRVGGSVLMVMALLANTLAFRPARGAAKAGGPMPMYQLERTLHVLATAIPFVVLLKLSGVMGAT